jgi:hypothetical protein
MSRMLRTLPFALALAALTIFSASCGSSGAKFRMFYAVPNGQAVDVLVDGKTVETAVNVNSVTPASGYLSVSSGSRHVQVFPTGTTSGAYFDGNVPFNGGTPYTFLLTGPTGNIQQQLFTDNNTAPTSGNAALRVIHASPSGPTPVDIYLSQANTQNLGSITISSLAFAAASSYVSAPASSYAFLVTPSGIQAIDIDMPDQSFAAGKIYTYVLVDVAGGGAMSGTPVVLNDN